MRASGRMHLPRPDYSKPLPPPPPPPPPPPRPEYSKFPEGRIILSPLRIIPIILSPVKVGLF